MIIRNHKFISYDNYIKPFFFYWSIYIWVKSVISGICHIKKKSLGLGREMKHESWHAANKEGGEPRGHSLCYAFLFVSQNLKGLSWLCTQEWACWVKSVKESNLPLKGSANSFPRAAPIHHAPVVCTGSRQPTGSCSTLSHFLKFYEVKICKK